MYPLKLRFEIARISLRNGTVAQFSQIHHTHFHAYYNIIIFIRYVYIVLLSDPIGNTLFCPDRRYILLNRYYYCYFCQTNPRL